MRTRRYAFGENVPSGRYLFGKYQPYRLESGLKRHFISRNVGIQTYIRISLCLRSAYLCACAVGEMLALVIKLFHNAASKWEG